MNDAFLYGFVETADNVRQEVFRFFRLTCFNCFLQFADSFSDRRFNSGIFCMQFSIGFYTADRRFNIRQEIHLPISTLLEIVYHVLGKKASHIFRKIRELF